MIFYQQIAIEMGQNVNHHSSIQNLFTFLFEQRIAHTVTMNNANIFPFFF